MKSAFCQTLFPLTFSAGVHIILVTTVSIVYVSSAMFSFIIDMFARLC